MIIFLIILAVSAGIIAWLFHRHLGSVQGLAAAELEKLVSGEPSPFLIVEQKIFAPAAEWASHHLPIFILRASEIAVKEARKLLLRIAIALGGVHDYLKGRKILLSNSRRSAYWSEVQEVIKNSKNGSKAS